MLISQVSDNTQLSTLLFSILILMFYYVYYHMIPSGATDYADFYYSTDDNPNWTFIATKQPQGGGVKEILVDYKLPLATIHRVRVNFRYSGGPSPCSNGSYDDHDDLVFAVSDSSSTSVTNSPTNKPTQLPTPMVRIHLRHIICIHSYIVSGWNLTYLNCTLSSQQKYPHLHHPRCQLHYQPQNQLNYRPRK